MFRRLTARGAVVLLGMTAFLLGGLGFAASAQAEPASPGRDRIDVVAHRGASAYAPENTLAAVRAASRLHTRWVENDVQRTRDGRLVVLHDTTLSRTTDVERLFPDRAPWNVADFTLAEIQRLDAGGWFGAAFAGERIPTLRQYAGLLDRTGQNLLLEIKAPELYPGIEAQILRELRKEGWLSPYHLEHKLIVQSFSADSIATVHRLQPRVRTGFLGTPAVADLPRYAAFADQINPPHQDTTPAYVAAVHAVRGAHGRPLEVYTWTVDSAALARTVAAAGVDGIITNKPDVVADAVGGLRSAS